MKKLKSILILENLLYLFIIILPILDITSFLFRKFFETNFSPSTFIRPIIPIVAITIIFFKNKKNKFKLKLIGVRPNIWTIYFNTFICF